MDILESKRGLVNFAYPLVCNKNALIFESEELCLSCLNHAYVREQLDIE